MDTPRRNNQPQSKSQPHIHIRETGTNTCKCGQDFPQEPDNTINSESVKDELRELQMPGFGVGDCYVIGTQTLINYIDHKIAQEANKARLDELQTLMAKHSRTYKQTVTDSN